MTNGRLVGILGAAAVIGAALAMPMAAASDGIHAELDGEPVSLEQLDELSCDDFEYPVLTCFATSEELEAAAPARFRSVHRVRAAATSGYVIAWEHADYGGSSRAMSIDYANLGSIGWNDRITSFKSFGATGRFWQHSPWGGWFYGFGGSTWVGNVGQTYNDAFSGLELD
jgi:hypothetical protein